MGTRLLTVIAEQPARPAPGGAADACAARELDRAGIRAEVRGDDGETVPAGSVGTVVGIWGRGSAYEVEFTRPVDALATVPAALVRAVSRAAG